MTNNKKTKFKIIIYLSLLLIVFFLISYFFYFPDLFVISDKNDSHYFSSTAIIQINKETLKALEELKRCGDWPLNQIAPNSNRGNPFIKKESTDNVMTAVPEVQCLSVFRSQ